MSILGAIGGVAGSLLSGLFSKNNADKQAALQKQFAQSGIQWKVADAKKAGVHPLAALGAQTTSYAPSTVGVPDFGASGQALGNAIHRTADPHTRAATDLALTRAGLENDLLRAQINAIRATRPPSSPAMPLNTNTAIPGQPATELGPAPEHTHLRTESSPGYITIDPRNSDAQKYEDRYGDAAQEIYGLRNWFADQVYSYSGMPGPANWELLNHRLRHGRDYGRQYRHR